MSLKRNKQEKEFIRLSVGMIEQMKINKCNLVQYQIAFRDDNGNTNKKWTNWMRYDGYEPGNSIPIKILTVNLPVSQLNILLEANNTPQVHYESYVITTVMAGLVALWAGYSAGKNKT